MKKWISSGIGIIATVITMNSHAAIMTGPYLGIGGSWNTVDETFDSSLFTSATQSGEDHYNANSSRLAPLIQAGYVAPLNACWLWGASLQWKYLGYKTSNENTSRGQYLPNSTFSSFNIFGQNVTRDFSSQTRLNNEFLLLVNLGMQTSNGYAYIGAGPALLTAANSIYLSSIHTPAGTGDHLTSGSVSDNQNVWGGAVQAGYNYYLDSTIFLNINYTYLNAGKKHFNNIINAAIYNGFNAPGTAELNLNRSISFHVQELMFSINKVFC